MPLASEIIELRKIWVIFNKFQNIICFYNSTDELHSKQPSSMELTKNIKYLLFNILFRSNYSWSHISFKQLINDSNIVLKIKYVFFKGKQIDILWICYHERQCLFSLFPTYTDDTFFFSFLIWILYDVTPIIDFFKKKII
jgi:hypothetical protein